MLFLEKKIECFLEKKREGYIVQIILARTTAVSSVIREIVNAL
jgi:hypothetical protein